MPAEDDATASDPKVQILDRTVCYQGFFRIERYRLRHRLFGGGWSRELVREVFERGHAAAILPYDPDLDRVVLVEQFRIGALDADEGPWTLEIVAGIVEEGETPGGRRRSGTRRPRSGEDLLIPGEPRRNE